MQTVMYQRDGDIVIRQFVFSPSIIGEVQDSPVSLNFTVHSAMRYLVSFRLTAPTTVIEIREGLQRPSKTTLTEVTKTETS